MNLRAEILEGLRWLWRQPLIRYMAFLTGGINLVNAGTGLIVIVLAQELGARPVDIGLIFSIGGIGGVVGSLVGGQVQKRFSFGRVIVCLVWVDVVLFPLFALAGVLFALGLTFCNLVILPLVSAFETPDPLPSSISDSVLHGEAAEAAPAGQTKKRGGSVATAAAE